MDKLEKWKQHWLTMSIEKQFESAVSIIKSLPKDGPYQPSNEMMLRFYGYYKQAVEGPCNDVKPSFWEVIKRAKWEAWHKLGDMPSEEAMMCYVDELKKIIETMSFSEEVSDFMDTLGPFYESMEHNEVTSPDESQGDSGIELEPGNMNALLGNFDDAFINHVSNHDQNDVEARAKLLESRVDKMMAEMGNVQKMMMINDTDDDDDSDLFEDTNNGDCQEDSKPIGKNDVEHGLKVAVRQLNCDMDHLKARVETLEKMSSLPCQHPKDAKSAILGELSGPTTAFFIAWPFVAFAIIRLCSK